MFAKVLYVTKALIRVTFRLLQGYCTDMLSLTRCEIGKVYI